MENKGSQGIAENPVQQGKPASKKKKTIILLIVFLVALFIVGAILDSTPLDESSSGGEIQGNAVTPTSYFDYEVRGDVRNGEYIELTAFNEDEELWTERKGVVVVPQEIDGKRVVFNLQIFEKAKYISELVIPDAGAISRDNNMVKNAGLTSLTILGGKTSFLQFYCPKLTKLDLRCEIEPVLGFNHSNYSDTSLEEIMIPSKCETIPLHCFPDTLKKLKCPQGIKFEWEMYKSEDDYMTAVEKYIKKVDWDGTRGWKNFLRDVEVEYYTP